MLPLPLPEVWRHDQAAVLVRAVERQPTPAARSASGRPCASMPSKYSRWSFVDQPTRIIQRSDMRLVAASSKPQYRWLYPVAHLIDAAESPGHGRRVDASRTAR